MGHTSLVSNEGCQMNRLALVILGESLDLSPMALGSFLGQEPFGTVPWGREFPVRLKKKVDYQSNLF